MLIIPLLLLFTNLLAEDKYYPLVVAWRFNMGIGGGKLEGYLFDTFYALLLLDQRRKSISIPVARYHFAGYLQLIFDEVPRDKAIQILLAALRQG